MAKTLRESAWWQFNDPLLEGPPKSKVQPKMLFQLWVGKEESQQRHLREQVWLLEMAAMLQQELLTQTETENAHIEQKAFIDFKASVSALLQPRILHGTPGSASHLEHQQQSVAENSMSTSFFKVKGIGQQMAVGQNP